MKAAVVGENALEIRDVPMPKPKPNEVLIKVRAIGLNRAELPGAYGSGHNRADAQAEAQRGADQSPRHRPQPRGAARRLWLGP
jgi:NADPH:quinone reductase-like Zn-dependent oxidoreductase